MKSIIGLCLLVIFFTKGIDAQHIKLHPKVDTYFSDSTYSSIIYKAALDFSVQRGIDEIHFTANYPALENEIITESKVSIEKKLNGAIKNNGNKKIKQEIAINLFGKAIYNGVINTLKQNESLRKKLFAKDLNDRILSFKSEITLTKNGKLHVKEKIKIANFNGGENNLIQRGITRDFPTIYCSNWGFLHSVPFNLIAIKRNGESEDFHIEKLKNGIRIYCGRKDKILPTGKHEYTIEYTTEKQVKFHTNRDELYWNVTGNGWLFTINEAQIIVASPSSTYPLDLSAYTGTQGSKEKNVKITIIDSTKIEGITTKLLNTKEGLTISISYPKGTFTAPTLYEEFLQLFLDNKFLLFLICFVIIHFILLFNHWKKIGHDPKSGIIIPQFEPPNRLSPAAIGYIYHQEFKDSLFAAAMVDLSVKQRISIDVEQKGFLFKSNSYLFKVNHSIEIDDYCSSNYGIEEVELDKLEITKGTYNKSFASLYNKFKKHLEDQVLVNENESSLKTKYLAINLDRIGIGVVALIGIFFIGIIYLVTVQPPLLHTILIISLFILSVLIQTLFMFIIKSYTLLGRNVADQILGFRMYLSTTETDKYNLMNPPELSLQLFEKYLPFAIALNVENEWTNKFSEIIKNAIEGGQQPVTSRYYHSMSTTNYTSFSSNFSSGLSSSISSASSPPSSTSNSGSFGGGSSGGGGGGGGGGGW